MSHRVREESGTKGTCRLEPLSALSGEGAHMAAVCPRLYMAVSDPQAVLGIETWGWFDTWRNLHMDWALDSSEESLLSLSAVMRTWWLHKINCPHQSSRLKYF